MEKDSDQVVEIGDGEGNSAPLLGSDGDRTEDGNGKASIAVIGLGGDISDGADEKLVLEERPNKLAIQPSKEGAEVKFNLTDSQNGDAKIDIESVKIAFAGMGKQELMKFANDPFWIRTRWVLFILFWLVWAAMLVGAIAIIVVAPKCSSPAPLLWWEQSPLYQVYVPSFKDGAEPQDGMGDLKGLLSKVDYIADLGIKGLTISTILKTSKNAPDDTIENFQEVDPVYGSLGDFKALVSAMKTRGIHLVMSFILNHSSNKHPWFLQSEKNVAPFSDFYVWAPSSGITSEEQRSPPNNWLNTKGGSAWEWSDTRGMYYLHQFHKTQPDLNFHNSAVIAEFKSILEFWLNLGVSGFQFEKVQYLLEDIALKNESIGNKPGKIHDEYDYYSHHQTTNLPEVLDILASLKQVVKNQTGDDGFVTITGSIPAISISDFLGNKSNAVVDLPQNPQLLTQLRRGYTGADVLRKVQQWLEVGRCSWQLGDLTSPRITSRLSAGDVDGLNMIVMLLPGSPITQYGEEIGMEDSTTPDVKLKGRVPMSWSNTTNAGFSDGGSTWLPVANNYETDNVQSQLDLEESHLKVYKALVEARNSPSIMYGVTNVNTTANDTVFAFSRIKKGNPGYVVAFNTAEQDVVADLTVLKDVAGELTVSIRSSNINGKSLEIKSKLPADAVPLPPKAALVLTFVPKKVD